MTLNLNIQNLIEISADETKFTPEFMKDFNINFHYKATIKDHLKYIAKCYCLGVIQNEDDFLEGYGKLSDFGIEFDLFETVIDEE